MPKAQRGRRHGGSHLRGGRQGDLGGSDAGEVAPGRGSYRRHQAGRSLHLPMFLCSWGAGGLKASSMFCSPTFVALPFPVWPGRCEGSLRCSTCHVVIMVSRRFLHAPLNGIVSHHSSPEAFHLTPKRVGGRDMTCTKPLAHHARRSRTCWGSHSGPPPRKHDPATLCPRGATPATALSARCRVLTQWHGRGRRSRLGCQVLMEAQLDGIRVLIPGAK
mmetsp:Transcript_19407/g.50613  ORF Transcript_19407/g.50613 Transcript_19407/m.50613 type:complete len:218 (-) Transcript_19407:519-1172(-)